MRRGLGLMHRRRRREGSTAVEFALVAFPFFILLFGILEIGLMLLVDALVETAASDAGRQIRTGLAQQDFLADSIRHFPAAHIQQAQYG